MAETSERAREEVCASEGRSPIDAGLEAKAARLLQIVSELGPTVVAFSGGVDSTLLLAVCLQVLGRDHVVAATADSPTLPRRELDQTRQIAAQLGTRHIVFPSNELANPGFCANASDRCYHCKQELFIELHKLAAVYGYSSIVYGANADDTGDYRPGMQAAQQAGGRAPLLEAGLSKEEVRALSRRLGLSTWAKPAMACLSSRVPYGQPITPEVLERVEQAEELLRCELGFEQVRVRDYGPVARIEVERCDLPRLVEEPTRSQVNEALRALGYTYVTIDLDGFRSGSMNEGLGATVERAPGDADVEQEEHDA